MSFRSTSERVCKSPADVIIRQVVGEDHQLNYDHHHFSLFKSKFGKSYATKEEHDHRFSMLRWCRGGLPGRCMPECHRRFGALAVELVVRRGGREAGGRFGFGADVIMTSESCRNGTERCNETLQKLKKKKNVRHRGARSQVLGAAVVSRRTSGEVYAGVPQAVWSTCGGAGCPARRKGSGRTRCNETLQKLKKKKNDVVVNIQGDEPLIDSDVIDGIVKALQATPDTVFSTAVTSLKPEDACDPNRVKEKKIWEGMCRKYGNRNGDVYAGEYFADKMHGFGVYRFANGHWYEGAWHEGRRQGLGMYTFRNGETQSGHWNNGILDIPSTQNTTYPVSPVAVYHSKVLNTVQEARRASEKVYDVAKVDERVNRAVAAANRAANAARVAAVKAVQKQIQYNGNNDNIPMPFMQDW
ncbi:hypothetical protein TEA_023535 [Camellia sinensis var. sinensis]|uniref:Uncharacterized protein n=1 Tax=Camellia sinensis var. sinensis TaxID=542762 RepID=A0A4S4F4X6_CAMSN|nr:hypothetical protein TEA_023535 [Camellia sinensis var. sinensis]